MGDDRAFFSPLWPGHTHSSDKEQVPTSCLHTTGPYYLSVWCFVFCFFSARYAKTLRLANSCIKKMSCLSTMISGPRSGEAKVYSTNKLAAKCSLASSKNTLYWWRKRHYDEYSPKLSVLFILQFTSLFILPEDWTSGKKYKLLYTSWALI